MASRRTAHPISRTRWWRGPLVGVVALGLVAAGCSGDGDDTAAPSGSTVPAADEGAATGGVRSLDRATVADSSAELDAIVEDVMARSGVPGVAVAVVYDDEVVYEAGYGVRSTEGDEPVTPATVFQLASLSKPISSTVMAGVVGEGTIAWDQPIAEVAEVALDDPWITDEVTFADTFSHRTGLPGSVAGNDLEAVGFERDEVLPRLELVPLDGFRADYSYSNWGMTMGGEAAAQVAGERWEELAERILFEPAGMTSTSYDHGEFLSRDDRAAIHAQIDGEWVPAVDRNPDPQAPAGGASSNVVDLARWLRLQMAEGALDGEQIIDADALSVTHQPHMLSQPATPDNGWHAGFYGLGWSIGTDQVTGATQWNHSGAFSQGAATVAKILPARDVAVVVLSNGAPVGAPEAIADAYLAYLATGDVDVDRWWQLWNGRFAGMFESDTDWSSPPADAADARPTEAYLGTYGNDYVGDVEVRTGDAGLELVIGPDDLVYELEHWDGDTFVYVDAPELPDLRSRAEFTVDGDGPASAVTLESLDGAGLGTLERRP